jgi:ABC-type Na+ efflux pump permease subunit
MRQPLYLRLRPFLRRELRARLVSAVVTVFVLCGLTWLGVSALTKIDSREAHDLRVAIGMEGPWTVCGQPGGPLCSYEDREQARIDAKHEHERRLRLAVLDEMERRIAHAKDRLDEATEIVGEAKLNPRSGALQGDTVALRQALSAAAVDLRPAPLTSVEGRRERLLWALDVAMPEIPGDCRDIDFDGIGWVGGCDLTRDGAPANRIDQRRLVLEQIALERNALTTLGKRIDALQARDHLADADRGNGQLEDDTTSRVELVADLVPAREITSDYQEKMAVAAWLAVGSGEEAYDEDGTSSLVAVARTSGLADVGEDLDAVANAYIVDLARLVQDPGAAGWQGGWLLEGAERVAISKPSVRYRSPITTGTQVRLFASLLMLLGAIMLVVVGPTVTATTTAREREAGTLPVLRMTGLSAGDIAMAMTIGPNVFALVAGGALVLVAATMLAATAGVMTTLSLLGIVLALSAATHLTAIGLGDALGQRVNAMVVGGLLGLGVLVPGLIGATMVVGDMAATGLLLGPLPATIGSIVSATGLPYARMLSVTSSSLAQQMLVFSMVAQGMLGLMCLLSWRRRVEQPWAPLFRPIEGALLGLISVGCSALALLDLSEQVHVQTYDQVNLVTFVATGFLMPVLGWLLVSSLVRPARAAAVASCSEARRAFGRFQLFVLLTSAALAGAYSMVLDRSGLGNEKSEIMWATIAQGLLVAETAVAALLLASRRREGRHRVLILGATIVLLQLALTAGVYNIEVEHVAMTQSAAHPLLVGMDASPYWVAFLVVLWAAGLGLVLAALLRERDRSKAEATADEPEPEGDGEGDDEQRWLH